MYSKSIGHKFKGSAIGVDCRFILPETSTLNKVVNMVKLMAEYDLKYVNGCGMRLQGLYQCSGGTEGV